MGMASNTKPNEAEYIRYKSKDNMENIQNHSPRYILSGH